MLRLRPVQRHQLRPRPRARESGSRAGWRSGCRGGWTPSWSPARARSARVCGSSQRMFVVRCNKRRAPCQYPTGRHGCVGAGVMDGTARSGRRQLHPVDDGRGRGPGDRRPGRAGPRTARGRGHRRRARERPAAAGGWRSGMRWRRPDARTTSRPSASARNSTDSSSSMGPARRCGRPSSGTTPVRGPRRRSLVSMLGREAWAERVGSVPVPSFTVTRWAWLREVEPAVAAAARGRPTAPRLPDGAPDR